jgi:hypothetical protein
MSPNASPTTDRRLPLVAATYLDPVYITPLPSSALRSIDAPWIACALVGCAHLRLPSVVVHVPSYSPVVAAVSNMSPKLWAPGSMRHPRAAFCL